MYSNIRQLIDAAWRRAGVRGDGDPIDAGDTTHALGHLNSILDTLSTDSAFAPGIIKRTVTPKANGDVVIGDDPRRVIVNIGATAPTANITTKGPHGLTLSSVVKLAGTGLIDGTYTVSSVVSQTVFTVTGVAASGTALKGAWRLDSEPDDCLIDLVLTPPGRLLAVNDAALALNEYPQDLYYAAVAGGVFTLGWYYETSSDPYPVVHTSGAGSVDLVMPQPGFTDVTLSTVINAWPRGMAEVVLWDLASILAAGYPDSVQNAIMRRDEAKGLFKKSRKKLRSQIIDGSAPGMSCRSYDFFTDSFQR